MQTVVTMNDNFIRPIYSLSIFHNKDYLKLGFLKNYKLLHLNQSKVIILQYKCKNHNFITLHLIIFQIINLKKMNEMAV